MCVSAATADTKRRSRKKSTNNRTERKCSSCTTWQFSGTTGEKPENLPSLHFPTHTRAQISTQIEGVKWAALVGVRAARSSKLQEVNETYWNPSIKLELILALWAFVDGLLSRLVDRSSLLPFSVVIIFPFSSSKLQIFRSEICRAQTSPKCFPSSRFDGLTSP